MRRSGLVPPLLGLACLAVGAGIAGIGLGVVPSDPASGHAPPVVLVACGMAFGLGGVAMVAYHRPRIRSAAGVTIVLVMGIVAAWIALWGRSDAISGGLPFLPHGANVAVARGVFGMSALMCFALFAWGARQIARGDAPTG